MILKERQKSILGAAISEYIRTAKPVASRDLIHSLEFGLSSATIRNELHLLDEGGYLEQIHVSAGRIPTDRGYRFFVDHLMDACSFREEEEQLIEEVFYREEEEDFVRDLSKMIARLSGVFAYTATIEKSIFYESGFSKIVEEPEFRSSQSIKTFARFADFFDEEIETLFYDWQEDEEERIFIGDENPLRQARFYTIILSSWKHPRGFKGFLAMVGPKRTNYARHHSLLRSIHRYAKRSPHAKRRGGE